MNPSTTVFRRHPMATFLSLACLAGLMAGCSNEPKIAVESQRTGGLWAVRVTSLAFKDGTTIPAKFTAEEKGISPPLRWSDEPPEARSTLIMVEDPDVSGREPFVHWIVYNIPADVTQLPEGVFTHSTEHPAGATQGLNSLQELGYAPPQPPSTQKHRYYFEVFALDQKLDLPPGADKAEVLNAIHGKVLVLSKGALVGTVGG